MAVAYWHDLLQSRYNPYKDTVPLLQAVWLLIAHPAMRFKSYLLGFITALLVMAAGLGLMNRLDEQNLIEHRAQVLRLGAQQGYLLRFL